MDQLPIILLHHKAYEPRKDPKLNSEHLTASNQKTPHFLNSRHLGISSEPTQYEYIVGFHSNWRAIFSTSSKISFIKMGMTWYQKNLMLEDEKKKAWGWRYYMNNWTSQKIRNCCVQMPFRQDSVNEKGWITEIIILKLKLANFKMIQNRASGKAIWDKLRQTWLFKNELWYFNAGNSYIWKHQEMED